MRFILTKELGRLAKWLRILGYDTQYFTEDKISSLIIVALRDGRTILTRNIKKMPDVYGIRILYIRSDHVKEQIAQVLKELNLSPDDKLMFSRCIVCNVELVDVEKEKVKEKVPEYVFSTQEDFVTCPECKRIYWQGTHWGNVKSLISQIENPRISADENLC
jgi:hypothetical protein